MKPIEPLVFPDVVPADLSGQKQPDFDLVDPRVLSTELVYQRSSDRLKSTTAVARILVDFRWSRFKVPTCVRVDGKLVVVDGQHTAIACASHPQITVIPVLIVDEPELVDRARAFVSHARDRLTVTPGQVWKALVAAGDEEALAIQRVCQAAGIVLLPFPPPGSAYKVGETVSLTAIRRLIATRGEEKAALVLAALRDSDLAPITADSIRAADALLNEAEYAADFDTDRLAASFRALGPKAMVEAKELAAAKGLPMWRALVAVIYRHRKGRGPAPAAPAAAAPGKPSALPTRRVIDRRPPAGPVPMGEPAPGRSALDQRRIGG